MENAIERANRDGQDGGSHFNIGSISMKQQLSIETSWEGTTVQYLNGMNRNWYAHFNAYLHTDKQLMPKRKRAWSSWNSISDGEKTCITYWLNKLQNLNTDKDYFLTLNPIYKISDEFVIKKVDFTHPYLNSENTKLQNELHSLL